MVDANTACLTDHEAAPAVTSNFRPAFAPLARMARTTTSGIEMLSTAAQATVCKARNAVLFPLSFGPISAWSGVNRNVASWMHP